VNMSDISTTGEPKTSVNDMINELNTLQAQRFTLQNKIRELDVDIRHLQVTLRRSCKHVRVRDTSVACERSTFYCDICGLTL